MQQAETLNPMISDAQMTGIAGPSAHPNCRTRPSVLRQHRNRLLCGTPMMWH